MGPMASRRLEWLEEEGNFGRKVDSNKTDSNRPGGRQCIGWGGGGEEGERRQGCPFEKCERAQGGLRLEKIRWVEPSNKSEGK